MKKFFLALLFFSILAYLYHFLTHTRKLHPVYLSPTTQLLQEKPKSEHEVYAHIKTINERNRKIESIFVNNMTIKVKQNISIVVHGRLAMQKKNLFRLNVWHDFFGKEMDIGSNESLFWFWSKRMDNPALYYAKHEDLGKTMLKTPLNPGWLMESLNLGEINTDNIEIAKFKNFWALIQSRKSANGENVSVVTLIDPQKTVVVGRYLYNSDGKLVASAETADFSRDFTTNALIPKKIYIIWYEERVEMEWHLNTPQINTSINPNYWVMPNSRNKIDMGN